MNCAKVRATANLRPIPPVTEAAVPVAPPMVSQQRVLNMLCHSLLPALRIGARDDMLFIFS